MGHPQVRWSGQLMTQNGGIPAQFQGDREGQRSLTTKLGGMWYLAVAGVTHHYSPHCLRHTFATHLLNAGVPLEVLKELMGHHSIRLTLRYTQLYNHTKKHQYDQAMAQVTQRHAVHGR